MKKNDFIKALFNEFKEIRYVAIYIDDHLIIQQSNTSLKGASSEDSDTYEELLVNPTLLKLASQRGNIDCGGLDYLFVAYGNFYQLVKSIKNGHISICLDKKCDIEISIKNTLNYILKHIKI